MSQQINDLIFEEDCVRVERIRECHPSTWSRTDVQLWLHWCSKEYELRNLPYKKFDINGKALCLMNEEMFVQRIGENGDLLYQALNYSMGKERKTKSFVENNMVEVETTRPKYVTESNISEDSNEKNMKKDMNVASNAANSTDTSTIIAQAIFDSIRHHMNRKENEKFRCSSSNLSSSTSTTTSTITTITTNLNSSPQCESSSSSATTTTTTSTCGQKNDMNSNIAEQLNKLKIHLLKKHLESTNSLNSNDRLIKNEKELKNCYESLDPNQSKYHLMEKCTRKNENLQCPSEFVTHQQQQQQKQHFNSTQFNSSNMNGNNFLINHSQHQQQQQASFQSNNQLSTDQQQQQQFNFLPITNDLHNGNNNYFYMNNNQNVIDPKYQMFISNNHSHNNFQHMHHMESLVPSSSPSASGGNSYEKHLFNKDVLIGRTSTPSTIDTSCVTPSPTLAQQQSAENKKKDFDESTITTKRQRKVYRQKANKDKSLDCSHCDDDDVDDGSSSVVVGPLGVEDKTRQIKFYTDYIDFRGDILRRPPQAKTCRILWEYLFILLEDDNYENVIRWEDHVRLVFRIVQAEKLAALWGLQKNRLSMTYEKLSRGMRYYYPNNIICREPGRRLLYRFMRHPEEIKRSIRKNGSSRLAPVKDDPSKLLESNNNQTKRSSKQVTNVPILNSTKLNKQQQLNGNNSKNCQSDQLPSIPLTAVSSISMALPSKLDNSMPNYSLSQSSFMAMAAALQQKQHVASTIVKQEPVSTPSKIPSSTTSSSSDEESIYRKLIKENIQRKIADIVRLKSENVDPQISDKWSMKQSDEQQELPLNGNPMFYQHNFDDNNNNNNNNNIQTQQKIVDLDKLQEQQQQQPYCYYEKLGNDAYSSKTDSGVDGGDSSCVSPLDVQMHWTNAQSSTDGQNNNSITRSLMNLHKITNRESLKSVYPNHRQEATLNMLNYKSNSDINIRCDEKNAEIDDNDDDKEMKEDEVEEKLQKKLNEEEKKYSSKDSGILVKNTMNDNSNNICSSGRGSSSSSTTGSSSSHEKLKDSQLLPNEKIKKESNLLSMLKQNTSNVVDSKLISQFDQSPTLSSIDSKKKLDDNDSTRHEMLNNLTPIRSHSISLSRSQHANVDDLSYNLNDDDESNQFYKNICEMTSLPSLLQQNDTIINSSMSSSNISTPIATTVSSSNLPSNPTTNEINDKNKLLCQSTSSNGTTTRSGRCLRGLLFHDGRFRYRRLLNRDVRDNRHRLRALYRNSSFSCRSVTMNRSTSFSPFNSVSSNDENISGNDDQMNSADENDNNPLIMKSLNSRKRYHPDRSTSTSLCKEMKRARSPDTSTTISADSDEATLENESSNVKSTVITNIIMEVLRIKANKLAAENQEPI
ncbi:hypothetical protein SNEBB_010966 [Seison nebaliae]|nr:hypothetical protein SNEBB_010966 [Seison nebaliae]